MVILGKTRMTEFAFGLSGQNGTQGTARNPWDAVQAARRAVSSSGAAVAAAARGSRWAATPAVLRARRRR